MKPIRATFIVIVILLTGEAVIASDCETNYKASGTMLRGKAYTTSADFSVPPDVAFQRIEAQLVEGGLSLDSTDPAAGTIKAHATSGGKEALVEVTTQPIDGGTRVHFSIDLPPRSFGNAAMKSMVCRFVESARIDPASRYEHKLVSFVRENEKDGAKVGVVESSAKKRAAKVALGALGGALLGAAHAAITGGDVGKEAAVGALAGGVVTFAITKIQDKRLATRDQVMLAQSYDAEQGYRTGVRSVFVTPQRVKPGEKLTIVTTYWALAPAASETFGVHRYAGIALTGDFLRGFRFNPEPFQFTEGGGEFQTTIELEVPAATDPGTYSLYWVVDGMSTGAEDSATFTVAG